VLWGVFEKDKLYSVLLVDRNYLRKYMANMASMANEILLAILAMFATLFVDAGGKVFPMVYTMNNRPGKSYIGCWSVYKTE
jgi:hypothetical protein